MSYWGEFMRNNHLFTPHNGIHRDYSRSGVETGRSLNSSLRGSAANFTCFLLHAAFRAGSAPHPLDMYRDACPPILVGQASLKRSTAVKAPRLGELDAQFKTDVWFGTDLDESTDLDDI